MHLCTHPSISSPIRLSMHLEPHAPIHASQAPCTQPCTPSLMRQYKHACTHTHASKHAQSGPQLAVASSTACLEPLLLWLVAEPEPSTPPPCWPPVGVPAANGHILLDWQFKHVCNHSAFLLAASDSTTRITDVRASAKARNKRTSM